MNGDPPVSREAIFVEKECPFRGMIRGGSVGMEAMIGTEFVASMDSIQQRQDVVVVILQVRHLATFESCQTGRVVLEECFG
jgi:hypothetical protein